MEASDFSLTRSLGGGVRRRSTIDDCGTDRTSRGSIVCFFSRRVGLWNFNVDDEIRTNGGELDLDNVNVEQRCELLWRSLGEEARRSFNEVGSGVMRQWREIWVAILWQWI